MTTARKDVILADTAAVYHCITRCVRRAYLCGFDRFSGHDLGHRKRWIRSRLMLLSEVFSIKIYSYAIMSNHVHLVLATDPDAVKACSDEELVLRWHCLMAKRDIDGSYEALSNEALQKRVTHVKHVNECRERLGSISYFMQYLNQNIARRANQEDECKGRFWEGRFKCQRLADEGAILACMAYVDLNPIRAGIVESPELSEFTSICERIQARQAAETLKHKLPKKLSLAQMKELKATQKLSNQASWLAPMNRNGTREYPEIPICLDEYLKLVDWTGRELRSGKRGAIPSELLPIVQRLDLQHKLWVVNIERYGSLFYHVAGKANTLAQAARKAGRRWFKGVKASTQVYCSERPEASAA